jgi:hypothetical protein
VSHAALCTPYRTRRLIQVNASAVACGKNDRPPKNARCNTKIRTVCVIPNAHRAPGRENAVSIKDQSAFYSAGAEAMKRLAARCGHGRLAQIFEDQAERYVRMAEISARQSASPRSVPPHIVPAQRPRTVPRMMYMPHFTSPHRPANAPGMVAAHDTSRERREG